MPSIRHIMQALVAAGTWLSLICVSARQLDAQGDATVESQLGQLNAEVAAAEAARQEAELAADPAAGLVPIRAKLRTTILELKELHESIAAQMRHAGREDRGARADGSPQDLSSLELHARYQLARALAIQGLCYPLNSPNRLNSLGQSVELLAALGQQELTPQLAWQVRLDEISGLREIGNLGEAEKKRAQADRGKPPEEVAAQLRAERIRLALARGRLDEALAEAGPGGRRFEPSIWQLELARLDAYLTAWRRAQAASDKAAAARWEKAAVDVVRAIHESDVRAAERRAETLLARAMLRDGATDNPQALLLAAQSLYRAGQQDEALAAYEAAAQRARTANDKGTYFDSHYAVGALLLELKRFAQSAERLRALAMALPQHERASQAHLLAIQSAAQEARRHDPPRLDSYKQLLHEHVTSWPESATAAQAWWWLGRLEEHQGAWQEAIRAYKSIKPESDHFADAVNAIGRCYEAALADLRERANANELLARDAVAYLQGVAVRQRGGAAMHVEAARHAVLAMARIELKESPSGGAAAKRLLDDALKNDPNAPAPWRQQAQLLLVAALAADGQADAAQTLLARLPIGSVSESLSLVELLEAVGRRVTSDEKRAVAHVVLTAIGDVLARPGELTPEVVKRLATRRVEALIELDQRDQALAELRKLAGDYPRDGELQESLAQLLASGGDETSRQAAALKWREVADHCRPGSERWFRAHLALARLQLELGNPSQARATVRLVEASQPDLGGPEMKAQFRQLLAECDRASAARPLPR